MMASGRGPVNDGVIVNVITDDNNSFPSLPIVPAGAGIGDSFDGVTLAKRVINIPTTEDRIKAHRDRLAATGGYMVNGKWFHSDQASRTQQIGLVLLGLNIPAGLQWKTMDGSFVTMTPTLAQQILAAAAANDTAIFAIAQMHIAGMNAAPDPSSYDFSGGWPARYQP